MRPIVFVVPGHIEARTGGYEYDRRIVSGLRDRGWPVVVQEIDGALPHPTALVLDRVAGVLAGIPDSSTDGPLVIIDGLALGAMPVQVERESSRLRIVALVHLPLAAEIGLDPRTAAALEASERRSLAAAALVVVTGKGTVATLRNYGVAPERIAIVEPGTDRAAVARGSSGDGPLQMLSVATVSPGKGYEVLIRALAAIPHRDWRLVCAGAVDRYPQTVDHVRQLLRETGLEDRVSFAGELNAEALEACYDRADLFVLATISETYGMAVAEAVAHGLPVVSTITGAIPAIVAWGEEDAAGLLVAPGDARAFGDALSSVLGDPFGNSPRGGPELRRRLAANARRVRERLPTWEQAVDRMAAALESIDRPSRAARAGNFRRMAADE